MKIPLIIITGPTASGKTGLAVEIAKRFNAEIVSADSMQIYKYMNIGTAKPTKEEMGGIVHHMIDIAEPSEEFSVSEFCDMARKIISYIHNRGKLTILTGGTGLYIDSLVNGVKFGENNFDEELRKELEKKAELYGNAYLTDMLAEFDKVSAERIHPNNVKRVIRAIEFYKLNGIPISEHQSIKTESEYNTIKFVIKYNREELYDRINKRVDIMMRDGLFEETRALYSRKMLGKTSSAAIGYKELISCMEGKISYDEAVELIKQSTRRYAKRQITWFKRNDDIIYLEPDDTIIDTASGYIKEFLNRQ